MKIFIVSLMLATMPVFTFAASVDYYLKIDGVDGETKDTRATTTTTGTTDVTTGDSDTTKGNVEYNWKVEEGESAATPGVEPDEIDVAAEQRSGVNVAAGDVTGDGTENAGIEPDDIDNKISDDPQETNLAILLSSGSDDTDEDSKGRKQQIENILKQGLEEADQPTETLSLNYEEIKVTVKQTLKLLRFIPLAVKASVEIDAEQNVKVKFPWWAALASGKDKDNLGQRIRTALLDVIEAQREALMDLVK